VGGCRVVLYQCNKYDYSMKICEHKHPNKPELLGNGNDCLRELVGSLSLGLDLKIDDAYNAIFSTVKGPEINSRVSTKRIKS